MNFTIGETVSIPSQNMTVNVTGIDAAKQTLTYQDSDGKDVEVPYAQAEKLTEKSGRTSDFSAAAVEVMWNSAHVALVNKFFHKEKMMSSKLVNFALADGIFEFTQNKINPMLGSIAFWATAAQPDGFMGSGDFIDATKALPICIIEQAIRAIRGGSFTSGFLKTLVSDYAAIAVANGSGRLILGRMSERLGNKY